MGRRPQVTISFAQSLDGRVATRTGQSQWISGPPTLELAHQLRDRNDAIMVGVGTVLADNPRLTCRIPGGRSPWRVVLDTTLRTPAGSAVVHATDDVPTMIVTSRRHDRSRASLLSKLGVEIAVVDTDGAGRLDLAATLNLLAGRGVASLLVEGGRGIITSMLAAGLCNRLVVVMAPMIIGEGTDSVGDLGTENLADALRGRTVRVERMGEDVVWEVEF